MEFLGIFSNSTTEEMKTSVTNELSSGSRRQYKLITYSELDAIYALIIPILAFGLAANVLNIIVYAKTGVRDNVTVSFLALSLSDLFYLMTISIYFTPTVIEHFVMFKQNKTMNWLVDRRILIFPFYWYALLFYETSMLITVYIAVVRCACVAIPFKVKSTFTARRAVIVIIAFFVSIFLLRLPMFMKKRIVRDFDPAVNRTRLVYRQFEDGALADQLNDIVNRYILNFGSMATVVVCLVVMGVKLRASARFRSSAAATKPLASEPSETVGKDTVATDTAALEKGKSPVLSKREIQVLRSVILVAVVFVTCQTPSMAYSLARRIIFFTLTIDEGFRPSVGKLLSIVSRIGTFFSVINASVNIFVYYNFNSRYRQSMKALWNIK